MKMYRKVIKVSNEVYDKIMSMCKALNITPNKLINQLLDGVLNSPYREALNSPSREERGYPISEKYIPEKYIPEKEGNPIPEKYISPNRESGGNPITFLRKGVTPSRDCTGKKVGKVYFIECADGSRAFIPEAVLPELVERFGMVVVEK